ncbi:hypothetical protein [Bradyrhizobium sp. Arg816]|uniref:hypothetical protein n=1 Tax=Bradyrhizobium sp. Arg816 TaxID=2998491 RepID=UPI00249EA9B8|nr:hypothetical protein [Bradyrhizobium sp. Arg816]MDI3567174.1 hypothetical protein [Bradyrhizobium sp. Arg816]
MSWTNASLETALSASELAPAAKSELKSLTGPCRSSFVALLVAEQASDDPVDDLGQIYGRNGPLLLKAIEKADARTAAADKRALHCQPPPYRPSVFFAQNK